MSLVIAHRGGSAMSGDFRTSHDDGVFNGGPKVRRLANYLIGAVGDGPQVCWLMNTLEIPAMGPQDDRWGSWLTDALLPLMRSSLAGGGFDTSNALELVVGTRAGIWACASIMECELLPYDYWAIGSGSQFARGLMTADPNITLDRVFSLTSEIDPYVGKDYGTVEL